MESSGVKAAERGGEKTTFRRDEINTVLQRDQVTVWERHIKNTMLTRLNVSALIWGAFGLARAADDLVHTFTGRRPNLSPWKSYWAVGPCPDTPRMAIYTTALQMGSIWIGCRAETPHTVFYDQMSNICVEFVSFVFYHQMQKLAGFSGAWSAGAIFWSSHKTVNCCSFYDSFTKFA